MNHTPVEGKDGFYRDESTKAIVNKNRHEYDIYIQQRKKLNTEKERIDNLESSVSDLKDDIKDIKTLLQLALNSKKDGE